MVGGSIEYRNAHKTVTSTLFTTEYVELQRLAAARGVKPSTFATQAVRDAIATAKEAEAVIPSLVPAGSE